MEYSGAGGKLIHEKNQKQKISWHCPFKGNYCKETKRKEKEDSKIKSLKEDASEILDKEKGREMWKQKRLEAEWWKVRTVESKKKE